MAVLERPSAVTLALFELHFACSDGATGTRHVWAPDSESARQLLAKHPSMFGIPHEHPLIGRASPLWMKPRRL